ncbi:purine catabolism regulator [Orenia metallireducens]|uniref:Purine catabolism regulatory protein n=1 Tax=Orenia metallireducens TaxID=1413210 RepID=A0A285GHC7_9FIRM|nr:PucR family transcriptional regulator [Orenia metallireducens]PRX30469.1 purine catabolism regulator [Orenia metallireducens]SNY22723.1 purine catabolism regulatory protein [Orenia metallireducens]
MALTVKEMLKISDFDGLEVLAGKGGLDRIISAVNVIDAPDVYNWIRGGEIFATTGYIVKDEPNMLKDIIIKMDKQGASGLLIKLKRFIDELPIEVIEVADKLNFPIISIPFNYTFAKIISPILLEIVNEQATKLFFSEQIHKSFTKLVINNGDTQQIIDTLSNFINEDIAFYDIYFDEVYFQISSDRFKEKLSSLSLKEVLERYSYYTIEVDEKIYGYLIKADNEVEKKDMEYNEIALEHAMTVLKLDIQKKISSYQIETKYRDQFIQDLLFNSIKSLEEVKKRASLYEWEFNDGLVTMVIDVDDFRNKYLEAEKNLDRKIREVKRTIFLKTKKMIKSSFADVKYATFGDSIVFLIGHSSKEEAMVEINSITDKLRREVKKDIEHTISIGVGSYKSSIMDIHKSYIEAQKAIELGRMIYGDDVTSFYDELGVYGLLKEISQSNSAKEFYNSYLLNLIEYDKENDTELLNTLKSMVRNDWNMREAAKELFIHYNTMKYRFKRISEILDFDLQDPKHKFNVVFSLKLLRLNQ